MDVLLLAIVCTLPALYVHVMYAISLTASQRRGLTAALRDNNPVAALAKLELLDRVPFDSHLWRVVTFRNPWTIYPSDLRDAIREVA